MKFLELKYQSFNSEVVEFKQKGKLTYWVVTNPDPKFTYYEDVDLVVRYYPRAFPVLESGDVIYWEKDIIDIETIETYKLSDQYDQREERLIWEQIDIYEIGVYQGFNYAFIISEKVKNLIIDNCLSYNYKVRPIKLISKNQILNY